MYRFRETVWGYGALCLTNLFAFRATKPARMRTATELVGTENAQWLLRCAQDASMIIAAWGRVAVSETGTGM